MAKRNYGMNTNGAFILETLGQLGEPITERIILRKIAAELKVPQREVRDLVRETLEAGIRFGYVQKSAGKYYMDSENLGSFLDSERHLTDGERLTPSLLSAIAEMEKSKGKSNRKKPKKAVKGARITKAAKAMKVPKVVQVAQVVSARKEEVPIRKPCLRKGSQRPNSNLDLCPSEPQIPFTLKRANHTAPSPTPPAPWLDPHHRAIRRTAIPYQSYAERRRLALKRSMTRWPLNIPPPSDDSSSDSEAERRKACPPKRPVTRARGTKRGHGEWLTTLEEPQPKRQKDKTETRSRWARKSMADDSNMWPVPNNFSSLLARNCSTEPGEQVCQIIVPNSVVLPPINSRLVIPIPEQYPGGPLHHPSDNWTGWQSQSRLPPVSARSTALLNRPFNTNSSRRQAGNFATRRRPFYRAPTPWPGK